ncbi:MAG: hypothetical protein JWN99_239 [Ilumatobacteraceae bacterium]|nr:hypothetical protein [Ilumatobacteraceae bacterium]
MSDVWAATAAAPATTATDVSPVVDPTPVGGVRIVRTPRRWHRRVLWAVVLAIGAAVLYYGITLYQVHATGQSDHAGPADAIVVMGAAQYDGTPSPLLQSRLDHVLELWSQGLAPFVVVTGGNQPGDRFTEASASKAYLVDRGVPDDAILEESVGHSSYQSLQGVAALLEKRGLRHVLLVSDPFHSLRIELTADELGLDAAVSPTRTSPVTGGQAVQREMKEAAGVAVGRIIGFRRLLSITG